MQKAGAMAPAFLLGQLSLLVAATVVNSFKEEVSD